MVLSDSSASLARPRTSTRVSRDSSSNGNTTRLLINGTIASRRRAALLAKPPDIASSRIIERIAEPIVVIRLGESARPAESVTTSSSSWASSKITTSCSPMMVPSVTMSRAYSQPLTITTSAVWLSARARSAKQLSPCGQRDAPGHSSLVTLTFDHAVRCGCQSNSPSSPVSVICDHSISFLISDFVRGETSSSSSRDCF